MKYLLTLSVLCSKCAFMLNDLLEGTITSGPYKWRGLEKLHGAKPEIADVLTLIPGYQVFDYGPKQSQGAYLPLNFLKMGQRPGTLYSYTLDPQESTPSGLKLKDHQRRAVSFIRLVTVEDQGCILGADPGCGKTISALQALWLDGFLHQPGLICGPLAARATWCGPGSDAFKHYGLTVLPIEVSKPRQDIIDGQHVWYYIHYDILAAWYSTLFQMLKPRSVIFDESHLLMNLEKKTSRGTAAMYLSKCATILRRVLLTGTPIPKTRMDLHGQLAIAQPNQWGDSKYAFGVRYAAGHREEHGGGASHWSFDGQSNTEELRARLAGVYLRYTKEQIPNELPTLTRHRIDVPLSEEILAEYQRARADIAKYLRSKQDPTEQPLEEIYIADMKVKLPKEPMKARQLVTVSTLKSILARGKAEHAPKVICDLTRVHRRLIVFTWKRDSAKDIVKALHELMPEPKEFDDDPVPTIMGPIDGADKWESRQQIAEEFAVQDWAVLVATRGSMGIAINPLSAADACLQVMPDWNPDANIQAESRMHRQGCLSNEVHSYYMIAPGTVDVRVMELLHSKGNEARNIAPEDCGGYQLAAALDPTGGEENFTVDEMFELLDLLEEREIV